MQMISTIEALDDYNYSTQRLNKQERLIKKFKQNDKDVLINIIADKLDIPTYMIDITTSRIVIQIQPPE